MSKSSPLNCGNVNMRGKKSKLLSCRCCECLDLRDKFNKKTIDKEIKDEINADFYERGLIEDEVIALIEYGIMHYEQQQIDFCLDNDLPLDCLEFDV